MKEEQYYVALDDYEHGVVIRSLNDKKTELKSEGKSTDAVDDLIVYGIRLITKATIIIVIVPAKTIGFLLKAITKAIPTTEPGII